MSQPDTPGCLDGYAVVLTVDEAAELLRISRHSAYAAVARGDIPSLKIGRRLLVPREGLRRLLAGDDDAR